VDLLILGAINFAIILPLFGNPIVAFDAAFAQPAMLRTWMAAGWLFGLLYYALSESLRGATIGKSLFRLRVTRPDDSLPGFGTALVRALLYTAGQAVPMLIVYGGDPKAYLSAPAATQLLTSYSYFIILALLFSTVRRRNGFAAMHDLLTKTRVVARLTLPSRPSIEARESAPASRETAATVGPFHILETLEKLADASPSPSREDRGEGEWLLAYDLRLLRKVWVRRVAPGTPPVPAALRNLGRPGRLRWLAGRRAPAENWDAVEAPSGKPLLSLIEQPQPWSGVRFWLYDLSVEISAAEKDGTLPEVLRLDRVWITRDGMAKLLDFPAPGGKNFKLQASSFRATPSSKDQASAQLKVGELRVEGGGKRSEVRGQRSEGGSESLLTSSPTIRFLGEVAAAALEGHTPLAGNAAHEPTIPLPIHARRFLECLPQLSAAQSIALSLKPLLQRVTVVSRLRRAALIAGCLILPVFAWGGMFFARGILAQAEKTSPGLFELSQILRMRDLAIQHPRMMPQWPGDREVSLYIAHRYRTMITNKTSWSGMMSLALIKGDARTFAEQSVAEHPALTAKEIEEAGAALDKLVPKTTPFAGEAQPWMPWLVFAISLGIYVAVPALLAALLFRGGLVLLIAGVTFVRGDGARASRLRVFWRAIVTWSPLALAAILFGFIYHAIGALAAGIGAAIFFSGLAAISLALPNRGLADRLAGTWPVPR
jgi:hypothetical protein